LAFILKKLDFNANTRALPSVARHGFSRTCRPASPSRSPIAGAFGGTQRPATNTNKRWEGHPMQFAFSAAAEHLAGEARP
jgi:hypothetical protein